MKYLKYLFLCSLVVPLLLSCSNDNSIKGDGTAPSQILTSEHIQSEAGRTITVSSSIKDNIGIKTIQLTSVDLDLDKIIDFTIIYPDTTLLSYDLSYKYNLPKTLTGGPFNVKILVTNLAGEQSTSDLLVSLDGDFDAPRFVTVPSENITVLIKNETVFNLSFEVSDNKELANVTLDIPSIDYHKSFDISGIDYTFSEKITLPSQADTYDMTITAIDAFGLSTTKYSKINVSEMPDFDKMYLADVSDASMLNSDLFGIPQLIKRTDAYTYRAEYYNQKANTAIKFIPQKTDFSPICFGPSISDNSILADNQEESSSIILPKANTYYAIDFNILSGEYSVNEFTPDATPIPIGEDLFLNGNNADDGTIPLEIGLIGEGLPGAGNWSPKEPLMLTQDANNPFLFSVECDLEKGNKIAFTIGPKHSWGWWPSPFWRWSDNSSEPEGNVYNGGENSDKIEVPADGTYRFEFDTYLLRSRFFPINN